MGYRLEGREINHFIWADNIFIIARNPTEMQEMINDVTRALHKAGFEWKPCSSDSPHAAVCLSTHHFNNDTDTVQYTTNNDTATVPNAEKTQILGK